MQAIWGSSLMMTRSVSPPGLVVLALQVARALLQRGFHTSAIERVAGIGLGPGTRSYFPGPHAVGTCTLWRFVQCEITGWQWQVFCDELPLLLIVSVEVKTVFWGAH